MQNSSYKKVNENYGNLKPQDFFKSQESIETNAHGQPVGNGLQAPPIDARGNPKADKHGA